MSIDEETMEKRVRTELHTLFQVDQGRSLLPLPTPAVDRRWRVIAPIAIATVTAGIAVASVMVFSHKPAKELGTSRQHTAVAASATATPVPLGRPSAKPQPGDVIESGAPEKICIPASGKALVRSYVGLSLAEAKAKAYHDGSNFFVVARNGTCTAWDLMGNGADRPTTIEVAVDAAGTVTAAQVSQTYP